MRGKFLIPSGATIGAALVIWVVNGPAVTAAPCSLPNQITNGQVADANAVMANENSVLNCLNSGQLPPTTVTPGSYALGTFTVDATGRLTAASNGPAVGSSGHALPFLDGNNTWSGIQTFGSAIGSISLQAGASYTLAITDCGTTVQFTSSSPVTLVAPNSLPAGCAVAVEQSGTGQVIVSAGAGATIRSPHGYTRTYGQYAILGLFVDSNVGGAAAETLISGDGA